MQLSHKIWSTKVKITFKHTSRLATPPPLGDFPYSPRFTAIAFDKYLFKGLSSKLLSYVVLLKNFITKLKFLTLFGIISVINPYQLS